MTQTRTQEEVRTLLRERYFRGIGVSIERELGVPKDFVYRFHGGLSRFPDAKLDALCTFLLRERKDPQGEARALLVASLAQKRVRAIDIARRFGVNKATVSRFKDGVLSFPVSKLEALAEYLRANIDARGDAFGKRPSRPAGDAPGPAARPLRCRSGAPFATQSTRAEEIETALIALATQFAWSLLEAAQQHAVVSDLDDPSVCVERALSARS